MKKQLDKLQKKLDAQADKVMARRAKKDTKPKKDSTRLKGDFHLDLRQDVAWDYYVDPRSSTFNNAYQSAIKAGYAETTAKCITVEEWWVRRVQQLVEMLPRAEEVILEDLNLDTYTTYTIKTKKSKRDKDDDEGFEDDDEEEEEVNTIKTVNPKLRKIRQEASFFVAETLGRKRYHKKVEMEASTNLSLVDGNELIDNLFRKAKKK